MKLLYSLSKLEVKFFYGILLWLSVWNACGVSSCSAFESRSASWGVDGCVTEIVDPAVQKKVLNLIGSSKLAYVRDREPFKNPESIHSDLIDTLQLGRFLHEHGKKLIAFAGKPSTREETPLPRDLTSVFAYGKKLGETWNDSVDGWEMLGEADVGYCAALPDEAVAFQKALYLGIKRGMRSKPDTKASSVPEKPVVMGALALPPGTWLSEACENDLLDYTDAYNIHFYGPGAQLGQLLLAHEEVITKYRESASDTAKSAELPIWITECGFKTVSDWSDSNRALRDIEAQNIEAAAHAAEGDRRVSLFMPFVLYHDKDPYSLLSPLLDPWAAWVGYNRFLGQQSVVDRALSSPARPSEVVMQWIPWDADSNKPGNCYRFRGPVIHGTLRIYNFSSKSIVDAVRTICGDRIGIILSSDEKEEGLIAPGAFHNLSLQLIDRGLGMNRGSLQLEVEDAAHGRSRLHLQFEAPFSKMQLAATELPLVTVDGSAMLVTHPLLANFYISSKTKDWIGVNGAILSESQNGELECLISGRKGAEGGPLFPPMAVAHITGFPEKGFLKLTLDGARPETQFVRVDLVDLHGQRFTIWEKFGAGAYGPGKELLLNLADFSCFFFGNYSSNLKFIPTDVREIQLRFYPIEANPKVRINIGLLTSKEMKNP